MTHANHIVHAALPLAVLEAVQELDTPVEDGLDEFHTELSSKRLGMSETVAHQIERFERIARSGGSVPAEELVALLRLVGRRHDASLVFTDAGRRAGRFAVRVGGSTLVRVLPGGARRRAGFRLVRRRARQVFGLTLGRDHAFAATLPDAWPVQATRDGAACAFYSAGVAEMLRRLIDFEGAVLHVQCRGRGDAACEWTTDVPRMDPEAA